MPNTSPLVDAYLQGAPKWGPEMTALRELLLECGFEEDLKWGKPCYSYENKNVVIITPFKNDCTLNFFKGSLLRNESALLVPPGANSQAARMLRFTSTAQIAQSADLIRATLREAIEVERSGAEVVITSCPTPDMPAELLRAFEERPAFREAFEALTPGRQRGYLIHYAQAKQSKTRASRIEASMPKIFEGKGMFD